MEFKNKNVINSVNHKSFSIDKIKQLGAKVVYENVVYNDDTNSSN